MIFRNAISLSIIIIIVIISLIGCSGSSSSLRYNSSKDNEKSEQNTETRYASQNNSIDDTTIVFDEEIPEYQDPSDLPEDDSKIDLTELMKNLDQKSSGSDTEALISSKRELMLMEIIKYMDTPYKFGGNSLNGIDCSAFTQNVYQSAWMLSLNRSAREQYQQGIVIDHRSELEFGDLVFFNTRKRVKPGHVGIFIGDNLFVHASSKSGVTISSLDHDYYNKRYMGARRIEE
ncbi:MAG: C40 family peptidase [Ignavibacterium sp.]|jgi:cell wall-associated NlpC family hydrolase|nr:C40 family peptidase [Ignavibacterium sp.]